MATANIIQRLKAEFEQKDIHWRAQVVNQNDGSNCMALAYLDARAVMSRLDSAVGPENWQVEYLDAGNGKLCCRLGIWISDRWVWKSDGAGETDVEGEKGAFSSALKRAAVLWGIGRYLYDFPQIWVPCESLKDHSGKYRFKKFTDNPWNHCNRAVRKDAEGSVGKAKDCYKRHLQEIGACDDEDQLDAFLSHKQHKTEINRMMDVIPDWMGGGPNMPSYTEIVEKRRAELRGSHD